MLKNSISRALDPNLGFLINWGMIDSPKNRPRLFCQLVYASFYDGLNFFKLSSSGADLNRENAILKATYEGFERYTLMAPLRCFRDRMTAAPDPSISFVDPSEFNYFNAEQALNPLIERHISAKKKNAGWIKAHNLTDEGKNCISLPVGCIAKEKDLNFYPSTTNGMAAGNDTDQVRFSALCEAIERDALMYSWWSFASPQEIDFLDILEKNTPIRELWDRFDHLKQNIRIRVIPTVLGDYSVLASCVIPGHNEIPFFNLGSAYRPRIEDAIFKALLELGQLLVGAHRPKDKKFENYKNFDLEFQYFSDNCDFYSFEESASFLGSFAHTNPAVKFNETFPVAFNDLDFILSKCRQKNIRIYSVDLTLPEISSLGAQVIKIVSPDLLPLNYMHASRPLGHKRLQNVTRFNSSPHPMS